MKKVNSLYNEYIKNKLLNSKKGEKGMLSTEKEKERKKVCVGKPVK